MPRVICAPLSGRCNPYRTTPWRQADYGTFGLEQITCLRDATPGLNVDLRLASLVGRMLD
jgi:hypothetical protein